MSSKSCVKLLLILFIGSPFTQIWAQQRSISLSPQPSDVRLLSSSDEGFNVHYNVGELKIDTQDTRGGEFDLISIDGFGFSNRIGEPMLPVATRIVSVPLNATPRFKFLPGATPTSPAPMPASTVKSCRHRNRYPNPPIST